MNRKRILYLSVSVLSLLLVFVWAFKKYNFNPNYDIGEKLDSLNGVYVYYNGGVNNVVERNTTSDGYNLGLKYQCVEFVKRYYYQHYNHKMPDSYGHAKDFFDATIKDGEHNKKRDLRQFTNGSSSKPKQGDLLIFEGTIFNRFGHVAIISKATDQEIEIIQQNPGSFSNSKETFPLSKKNNKWEIYNGRVLGWLRKE